MITHYKDSKGLPYLVVFKVVHNTGHDWPGPPELIVEIEDVMSDEPGDTPWREWPEDEATRLEQWLETEWRVLEEEY